MKDNYYFPHEMNARNDVKLLTVRNKYGMQGYGIYFAILEILREQHQYKFKVDLIQMISFQLMCDASIVEDIVFNYDLFVISDGWFFSRSQVEKMEEYDRKKALRVAAGQKGGLAKAANFNTDSSKTVAMLEQTHSNAVAKVEQCSSTKLEYSKLENSKVNKLKINTNVFIPSEDQKNSFQKFQSWLYTELPEVSKMAKPFTVAEYITLIGQMPDNKSPTGFKQGISKSKVVEYLQAIENNKTYLKKYRSPYLCVLAWHKKDTRQ